MQVLAGNPKYGVVIPRFGALRKMRIQIPKSRLGKSGGYRCIYSRSRIDEIEYVVFLGVFFKGEKEDLSNDEYAALDREATDVLSSPLDYAWEDA